MIPFFRLPDRAFMVGTLLLLLLPLAARAQTITMSPTDGPYGGTVVDLLLDRDGSLFAATSVGLFRSSDNGKSWEMNAFAGINVRYLRRDSVGYIYVGTQSGLYRSNSGRRPWSHHLSSYGVIDDIAFHRNGSRFFLADTILYRSTGMSDWEKVFSDSRIRRSRITTAGSSTVYLNDFTALMRSRDNGATWCTMVKAALPWGETLREVKCHSPFVIAALLPVGGGDSLLTAEPYESRLRWNCGTGDSVRPNHERKYRVFLRAPDGSILAGTSKDGILRSVNQGRTWSTFVPLTEPVNALQYASDGSLIAGTTGSGIIRIENGRGVPSAKGMSALYVNALAVDSAGSILAGTNVGIWRTSDKGETWDVQIVTEERINSIEVAPDGTIYAGGTGVTPKSGVVRRYRDDGQGWTQLYSTTDKISAFTILEAHDDYVFFASSGGCSSCTGCYLDAGWFTAYPLVYAYNLEQGDPYLIGSHRAGASSGTSMVTAPDGALIAALDPYPRYPHSESPPSGLYRFHPGGEESRILTTPVGHYHLLMSPDSTHYAFAHDTTAFRSNTLGGGWGSFKSNIKDFINLPSANKDGELLLIQNGTLYRSIDKGSFWEEHATDLPSALAVTTIDRDGYLYAGGDGLRVYRSSMTTVSVDDEDGTHELSVMTVAPNPSEGEAELRFHLEERGEVRITVVDMSGKVHIEKKMQAEAGELMERLDLSTLPSGAYTVVVEQGEKRMEKRILVVR